VPNDKWWSSRYVHLSAALCACATVLCAVQCRRRGVAEVAVEEAVVGFEAPFGVGLQAGTLLDGCEVVLCAALAFFCIAMLAAIVQCTAAAAAAVMCSAKQSSSRVSALQVVRMSRPGVRACIWLVALPCHLFLVVHSACDDGSQHISTVFGPFWCHHCV
jgi:hypothetical protein